MALIWHAKPVEVEALPFGASPLSAEDFALVDSFLARREQLDGHTRQQMADQIVAHVGKNVELARNSFTGRRLRWRRWPGRAGDADRIQLNELARERIKTERNSICDRRECRKVGVLIDIKKHGAIWEDFWDGHVSESRRKEKSIPYEQYRAAPPEARTSA